MENALVTHYSDFAFIFRSIIDRKKYQLFNFDALWNRNLLLKNNFSNLKSPSNGINSNCRSVSIVCRTPSRAKWKIFSARYGYTKFVVYSIDRWPKMKIALAEWIWAAGSNLKLAKCMQLNTIWCMCIRCVSCSVQASSVIILINVFFVEYLEWHSYSIRYIFRNKMSYRLPAMTTLSRIAHGCEQTSSHLSGKWQAESGILHSYTRTAHTHTHITSMVMVAIKIIYGRTLFLNNDNMEFYALQSSSDLRLHRQYGFSLSLRPFYDMSYYYL